MAAALCVAVAAPACKADESERAGDDATSRLRLRGAAGHSAWQLALLGTPAPPDRIWIRVGTDDWEERRGVAFQLTLDTPPTVLAVKYEIGGRVHGPFVVPFDPDQLYLDSTKDALDALRLGWAQWSGDSVDFGLVGMSACDLARIDYGFDGEPNTSLALPRCNRREPWAEPWDRVIPADPGAKEVVVQLTFRDGEKTDVVRIRRPTG